MVDGSYKQIVKDRGGVVEQATSDRRDELSTTYYNICEERTMCTPDGQKMTSPYPYARRDIW